MRMKAVVNGDGTNKIPYVIHYFWFGGGSKPDSVLRCIESWKKFCPDFEIKEWNEENYDIHKHSFMEKAYNDRKWAYVSDYARLDVLYNYGGIYLDTDVEVIRDLKDLCNCDGYFGFERADIIGDGAGFGFAKGVPILKEMMACYDGLDEYVESPKLRTGVLLAHGLRLDGSRQNVDGIEIYPVDYLCPMNYKTGKIEITGNTYSIHHFDGSWKEGHNGFYTGLMRLLNRILGEERGGKAFEKLMKGKDSVKRCIGR